MSFKKVMYLVVLIVIIVSAGFLLVKKPSKNTDLSDTAQLIALGKTDIACKDALWLFDTMSTMMTEKKQQAQELGDNITEEEAQRFFAANVTPSQSAINKWHDELVVTANNMYIRAPEQYQKEMDKIGETMMEIYYTVQLVQNGQTTKDEVYEVIKDRFCATPDAK